MQIFNNNFLSGKNERQLTLMFMDVNLNHNFKIFQENKNGARKKILFHATHNCWNGRALSCVFKFTIYENCIIASYSLII